MTVISLKLSGQYIPDSANIPVAYIGVVLVKDFVILVYANVQHFNSLLKA